MIVVLDVNILASAAASEFGLSRIILRTGLRRQYQLVVSRHILKKLDDTLKKPYFAARLDPQDRMDFVDLVKRRARCRKTDRSVRGIAPDLEDDLVLGTAVAASADFLVTGDKGLLEVGNFRGVRILTAEAFLLEMERN